MNTYKTRIVIYLLFYKLQARDFSYVYYIAKLCIMAYLCMRNVFSFWMFFFKGLFSFLRYIYLSFFFVI